MSGDSILRLLLNTSTYQFSNTEHYQDSPVRLVETRGSETNRILRTDPSHHREFKGMAPKEKKITEITKRVLAMWRDGRESPFKRLECHIDLDGQEYRCA